MSNTFDRPHPSEPPYAAPKKRGCGCWVWGCLTVLLLMVLGTAITGYLTYRYVNAQVAKFTSEKPAELPEVEYTEQEMAALESRFENFRVNAEKGLPTEEISLTADDLNALVSKNESLKGRLFIRIENDQISGDVSIPLEDIPIVGGRYLNGSATFDVSMENDRLVIKLIDAEVKGEKVPKEFITSFGKENLAKSMYDDEESAKVLNRIEDLRIEDGKVILKLRASEETTVDASAEKAPAAEAGLAPDSE